MSEIQTVAVIGAGRVGRDFARLCADRGLRVTLEDVMPSKLRKAQEDFGEAVGVRYASTVEDAVHDADLAVDFVPDELESKLEIFSMLDRMAPPRTVLCTPSDALSITDLASCTYRAERCIAVRPTQNLAASEEVRVLYGPSAIPEVLEAVERFWHRLGKTVTLEADPDAPMLVKNQHVPTS